MKINNARDMHLYFGAKTAPSDAGEIFPDRIASTSEPPKQRSIEDKLRLPIYLQGSRKRQMATNGFHQLLVSHKVSKVQLERFSQAIKNAKNTGEGEDALINSYLNLEESAEGKLTEQRKKELKAKVKAIQTQLSRSYVLRYAPFSLYGQAKRAARKALPAAKARHQREFAQNLKYLDTRKKKLKVAQIDLANSVQGTKKYKDLEKTVEDCTLQIKRLKAKIENHDESEQWDEEYRTEKFYADLINAKEMKAFYPRYYALTNLIGSNANIAASKTLQRQDHNESQVVEKLRISLDEERSISSETRSHLSRLLAPDTDRSPDALPRQSSMSSQGSVKDHSAIAGADSPSSHLVARRHSSIPSQSPVAASGAVPESSAAPLHNTLLRFTSMPRPSAAADRNSVAGSSSAPPVGPILRQHSLPARMTDVGSGAKRRSTYRFSELPNRNESDRLTYLENLASERGIKAEGSDHAVPVPKEVAEESLSWILEEVVSVKSSLSPAPDLSEELIDASIIAAYEAYRRSANSEVALTPDGVADARKWLNKTLEEGIAFLDGISKDKNLPVDSNSLAATEPETDENSESEDDGAGVSRQRKKLSPSGGKIEEENWTSKVRVLFNTVDYSSTYSLNDAGRDGNPADK